MAMDKSNERKRKFIQDNEGSDVEKQQVKRRRINRKNQDNLPQQPPENTLFNDAEILNAIREVLLAKNCEVLLAEEIYGYYNVIEKDDIEIYDEVIQPMITSECRMYIEGASHMDLQLADIEEEVYVHNILECYCQQNGDCYHHGKEGRNYFHKHVVYMQLRTGYYNHGYKQIMEHLELQLDDGGIQFDEDHIDIIGKTCDLCDHYKCICSILKREFADHPFWC